MRLLTRRSEAGSFHSEKKLFPTTGQIANLKPWSEGFSTATPGTISVTAGGTADTQGSWAQADASTEADIYELELALTSVAAQINTNTSGLIEVGVGGAGSEVVVVSNVQMGFLQAGHTIRIPIFIPAGSRIALRARSAVASRVYSINVRPNTLPSMIKPADYCVTIGDVPASSRGTVLTLPGANNTKGSWTQLTAVTTERLMAVHVCVASGSNNMTAQTILTDIGVGASGFEQVIIPDIQSEYTANEEIWPYGFPRLFEVDIPEGSRIAARFQTSAVSTNHNCHLIGIPWRR